MAKNARQSAGPPATIHDQQLERGRLAETVADKLGMKDLPRPADAVALVLSEEGAGLLAGESLRAIVLDAFAHCNFIGFTSGAVPLLKKAGVDPGADEGLVDLSSAEEVATFIVLWRELRLWSRKWRSSCRQANVR